MRALLIFLGCTFGICIIHAQTTITSNITTNTTWTSAGSPYLIQPAGGGTFIIESEVTLTIEAGVQVVFPSFPATEVKGTIEAFGQPFDSVYFAGAGGAPWSGFISSDSTGSLRFQGVQMDQIEFGITRFPQVILQQCQINQLNVGLLQCGKAGQGATAPEQILIEDSRFGSPTYFPPAFAITESDQVVMRNTQLYSGGLKDCVNSLMEDCELFNSIGAVEGGNALLIQNNVFANGGFLTLPLDSDIQLMNNRFEGNGVALLLDDPSGLAPNVWQGNSFCMDNPGASTVLFNTSAAVTDVDLSNNCWCTTDSQAIMAQFDIYTPNPNPNLPNIQISPYDSTCLPNQVYPGDANYDQAANVYDLLPIGLHFGTTGPVRPNASLNWVGQDAPDWSGTLINGVNLKHVDCDGDGTIGNSDTLAIVQNYGLTHNSQRPIQMNGGVPLYLDPLPASLLPGDTMELVLYLGNLDTTVQQIYGIAFSIDYDTSLVAEGGMRAEFDPTWLGDQGANLLTLAVDHRESGTFDLAEVRTDQTNVSGFGPIARIIVILDDDISKREIDFSLSFRSVLAVDANETSLPINAQAASSVIIASRAAELSNSWFRAYPSPATNELTVKLKHLTQAELRVFTLDGRQMRVDTIVGTSSWSVRSWSPGVYILEVRDQNRMYRQKIMVHPTD
ncbi:MAG: T9SS type A sorting domain-containing protein [Bacteroidota bacterium]